MSIEQWTTIGGGLAGGIVAVWRVGCKVATQTAATQRKLDAILRDGEELYPNAGTSLRDAVNRIESGMVFTSAKLRLSFENAGVDAFEADKYGAWTSVFGNFADTVGLDDDELLGSGWVNALAERSRDSTLSEWDSSISTGRDIRILVAAQHISGGAIQPYRIHARRLEANGSTVGFFGVIERHPPPPED